MWVQLRPESSKRIHTWRARTVHSNNKAPIVFATDASSVSILNFTSITHVHLAETCYSVSATCSWTGHGQVCIEPSSCIESFARLGVMFLELSAVWPKGTLPSNDMLNHLRTSLCPRGILAKVLCTSNANWRRCAPSPQTRSNYCGASVVALPAPRLWWH